MQPQRPTPLWQPGLMVQQQRQRNQSLDTQRLLDTDVNTQILILGMVLDQSLATGQPCTEEATIGLRHINIQAAYRQQAFQTNNYSVRSATNHDHKSTTTLTHSRFIQTLV